MIKCGDIVFYEDCYWEAYSDEYPHLQAFLFNKENRQKKIALRSVDVYSNPKEAIIKRLKVELFHWENALSKIESTHTDSIEKIRVQKKILEVSNLVKAAEEALFTFELPNEQEEEEEFLKNVDKKVTATGL